VLTILSICPQSAGVNFLRPLCISAISAVLLSATSAQAAAPTSEFTSTDTKKYKLVSQGEGSGTAVCPGLAGYQILFQVGDDRSWIDLNYNGQTVPLATETFEQCQGQRPSKANAVVQWRGFRNGNQFKPYGLIFRMKSENPNRSQKPFETLVVVKLDGLNSKVVGHAAGNTEAEQLADRLCMASEPTDAAPKNAGPQTASPAGQMQAPGGSLNVEKTEDETVLTFPNGQKFTLPAGKGLLGPSDRPTDAKPFELEEGWLVALNEQPVTKTSIVHLYLKGQNGKWTELPNIQQRLLKIAAFGKSRMNTEFVRVESLDADAPGRALMQVETFKAGSSEPITIPVAVSKTGNLSYGGRGE
jgi:hypothetical protein